MAIAPSLAQEEVPGRGLNITKDTLYSELPALRVDAAEQFVRNTGSAQSPVDVDVEQIEGSGPQERTETHVSEGESHDFMLLKTAHADDPRLFEHLDQEWPVFIFRDVVVELSKISAVSWKHCGYVT